MAIEIVDFPIENGESFHSFLLVYQRVYVPLASMDYTISNNWGNTQCIVTNIKVIEKYEFQKLHHF